MRVVRPRKLYTVLTYTHTHIDVALRLTSNIIIMFDREARAIECCAIYASHQNGEHSITNTQNSHNLTSNTHEKCASVYCILEARALSIMRSIVQLNGAEHKTHNTRTQRLPDTRTTNTQQYTHIPMLRNRACKCTLDKQLHTLQDLRSPQLARTASRRMDCGRAKANEIIDFRIHTGVPYYCYVYYCSAFLCVHICPCPTIMR